MSLYGNVKKIGAASFQFDRKYQNRAEMDENASVDGVYAGRYVLVEYGYRFGKSDLDLVELTPGSAVSGTTIEEIYQSLPSDAEYDPSMTYYTIQYNNSTGTQEYIVFEDADSLVTWASKLAAQQIYKKVQKINYSVINTPDGSVRVDGIVENESYLRNANKDLNTYGAVYDSTVWQKVYINEEGIGRDKYVMVAELNAMAPKLDIKQEVPLDYQVQEREIPNYRTNGVISGKINDRGELTETVRLTNVKEIANKPHFDTALDTELTYLLHLPTTLNLELNNDTVDYNENGFNIVYSYPESEGVSTIAWIPKGHDSEGNEIFLDDYDLKEDGSTDNGGNPYALLNGSSYDMDTKMLFMSFPALGNAMNGIYNLIYGKPDPLDDLEHGAMRPYFKRFLNDLILTNRAIVRDRENVSHYVTYDSDDPLDPYIYVTGKINKIASPAIGGYDAVHITGLEPHEYVEIRFEDQRPGAPTSPNNYYKLTSNEYQNGVPKDRDGVATCAGEYVLWDILRNKPLEMLVHTPTGDEDPDMEWLKSIPGLADILANADSGLDTVLSSIFGYVDPLTGTTRYYLYNDWTISTEDGGSGPAIANKPKIVGGYPETFITVEAGASDKNILGEKISESPGYMQNYQDPSHPINYPHIEIVTSKVFSGGNYKIDFDRWQLVNYVSQDIDFMISIYEGGPTMLQGNNEQNQLAELNNQTKSKMSRKGNKITFFSTAELTSYPRNGQNKKWVIFDVDTGFKTLSGSGNPPLFNLYLNGVPYTDVTEEEMLQRGAEPGHIFLDIDAEAAQSAIPLSFTLSAAGFNDTTFTISYKGVQTNTNNG